MIFFIITEIFWIILLLYILCKSYTSGCKRLQCIFIQSVFFLQCMSSHILIEQITSREIKYGAIIVVVICETYVQPSKRFILRQSTYSLQICMHEDFLIHFSMYYFSVFYHKFTGSKRKCVCNQLFLFKTRNNCFQWHIFCLRFWCIIRMCYENIDISTFFFASSVTPTDSYDIITVQFFHGIPQYLLDLFNFCSGYFFLKIIKIL